MIEVIDRTQKEDWAFALVFEYPSEGELWLRVVHSSESDYSPYQFSLFVMTAISKPLEEGSLVILGVMGNPLQFEQSYSLLYRAT